MHIPFKQVLTAGNTPVNWLVHSLIAQEERVVFCGEWSAYKSWILLHLGLHIAAGRPWLGFPVTQGRVLYVDEEMHFHTLSRRIRLLADGMSLYDAPFYVSSREGLTVKEGIPSYTGYNVIIVESLRRVLVGNENQACDIANFWRNATRIFTGSTLLLSHHMNKPYDGVRSRDRASGSTDIMAGCDAAFAVTRIGASSARIECVRSRVAEEAPSLNIRVSSVDAAVRLSRLS